MPSPIDPHATDNRLPNCFIHLFIYYLIKRPHDPTDPTFAVPTKNKRNTSPALTKRTQVSTLWPPPCHRATVNALDLKHAASKSPETPLDLYFKPTHRRYRCRPHFFRGGISSRGGTNARLARQPRKVYEPPCPTTRPPVYVYVLTYSFSHYKGTMWVVHRPFINVLAANLPFSH